MKKKRIIPLHTIFFGILPVIGLYSANQHLVKFQDALPTIAIMIVVSVFLVFLGKLLFRDWLKAAVWGSIVVTLLTRYGAYQNAFLGVKIPFILRPIRMDHNFYLWSSLILISVAVYLLRRYKGSLVNPTKILNLFALVMLLLTAFKGTGESSGSDEVIVKEPVDIHPDTTNLPDIYYIVVDAYGRDDILKDLYGYDNEELLNYLKEKGFYVAGSSHSNYGQTVLSLPSALNMSYANKVAQKVGVESEDRKPLKEWYLGNRTFATLRKLGYKVVATDAPVFDLVTIKEDADIFYETPGTELNLFENEFLNSSVIRAFNSRKKVTSMGQYSYHRKKILNAFDKIRQVPKMDGHFFVHGHVLAPHQPFVFDENGEPVDPTYDYTIWNPMEKGRDLDKYRKDYIGQLKFVNKKIKETVDSILALSSEPPVIIIQGDHGPASEINNVNGLENNNFKERMTILNAYYFPDHDYSQLYDSITPVNSFRVIFNQFYGADMGLLDDKSMYSSWLRPYMFFDVTDSVRRESGNY